MKRKCTLIFGIIFFLISFSIGIQAQLGNPLAYYQFNETSGSLVVDSSGNGFNADADCSACWEAEGKYEGAFHFSANERIDLPADDIALTSAEGSVAFWLRLPQSSTSDINCIWWAGESDGDMFGPQNEMHINSEFVEKDIWSGGEMVFVIVDGLAEKNYFMYSDPWKGSIPAAPPSGNEITVADNEWHHVACTWDAGNNMALYIDGEAIWDTMVYNTANTWDCKLMTLGVANQRSNRRLNGYLDEFRIYNEALNAADIESIYNFVPDYKPNKVESLKETSIALLNNYPNPANHQISFLNSLHIETVEIYNLTGAKILVQQVSNINDIVEISIDELSSGFYLIRAFNNDKLAATGKFYKE